MLFEEPKTQAELDEEKKEKEEKEKLEKDKLKLSHTQKVKQTKTQISVIRKINPKMKKEDMLLMQNGTRKGFAMKIKTRLLGFKMVRFNMGAQGILIPRSVNNELEGKVDSIGDEDPAKNKSILNKGPKWKTAVTSVKKWYVLFILCTYQLRFQNNIRTFKKSFKNQIRIVLLKNTISYSRNKLAEDEEREGKTFVDFHAKLKGKDVQNLTVNDSSSSKLKMYEYNT